MTALIVEYLPELGHADAERFAIHTVIVMGALWMHAHPSEAVKCAYEADPELADMKLDFTAALTEMSAVVLAGLFARK